ncbi:DUF2381 family protein [Myxococcus llanfairpwllgwyngyllgogerychwyrndrobwllllantysiliogogogochensis]|uniref:DUF2381 family protein n=1 Tax=Myxococcus llanfairpwllgwyngyllgogerychwyrndrobwllllantysiliogogogochensis TaxID=2590453 RepID=UPI0015F02F8F|nr:DUF2381 family protein [Myxococcus llanfairpwllgwyngyllgogerychwyrndrobwllllantysiliogogogochensis]
MFLSLARLALPLVFLMGLSATAQAQDALRGREMKRRRVSLTVATADKPVELHVAPDYLTALEFDSPIDRAAVALGDSGSRLALFEVTARSILLKPAMDLGPGRGVELTVPFADGSAPARVVFSLVTHPSDVDAQVMVSRLPRTAEAIQAELDEVRAACSAKDAELEALRARTVASGPAGMIFAGLLDVKGVQGALVDFAATPGAMGLATEEVLAYWSESWAALAVRVRNTGSQPWTPAEARLSGVASGERINVLAVRMREPRVEPGKSALVVVETRAPSWPEGAVLRLELRDSDGGRRLLIPRISF